MWDLVFEHKDFVVINKPCGISVHSESEGEVCLTASLAQQLGVERVWLVHRLDKATSGLLKKKQTKNYSLIDILY